MGYVVSKEGIRPYAGKINGVLHLLRPLCQKEHRSFVTSTASFVNSFNILQQSLHHLTNYSHPEPQASGQKTATQLSKPCNKFSLLDV